VVNRRAWLGLLAAALVALAGCRGPSSASFNATDISGAEFGRRLSLTDHLGKPRTLEDFKGKVIAVFFGYTQCPDVCPTTLATLKEAREKLGSDGNRLQVLFVTLDPERDTEQVLANYVAAFDPGFVGLYGDLEATAQAAREFKVFFGKNPGKTPTSYTIDHSAAVFVFDTQGRIRLFCSTGQTADAYLHDFRALLAESR
jgi:protein SCO1/2